jgi:hypothetical protein
MESNVAALRALSDQLVLDNPAKLLQAARARHLPATLGSVRQALEKKATKQVFAPKVRSEGRSAAEAPQTRYQLDIADLQKNTRGTSKYFLQMTDVFTREA